MNTIAVIAHPTKVDTLQAEVHKLHHTVDSLNSQLHDFGIASTYYHDIINANVVTFSTIVAIIVAVIGLLSWRVVKQTALNVKEELSSKWASVQMKQDAFNKVLQEKMQEFDKKDAEHFFNNSRLMYMTAYDESQFVLGLLWALNAVLQSCRWTGSTTGLHQVVWIEKVRVLLTKNLPKKQLDLMIDSINELMADLKRLKDKDIDKVVEEVKAKVYKEIYA